MSHNARTLQKFVKLRFQLSSQDAIIFNLFRYTDGGRDFNKHQLEQLICDWNLPMWMQSMHEAFPLLPGGPNINSTLLAVSNLSPRLCRKDLSPKFRPVWVRGTSRRDQILVPYFEAKMTSSHGGACMSPRLDRMIFWEKQVWFTSVHVITATNKWNHCLQQFFSRSSTLQNLKWCCESVCFSLSHGFSSCLSIVYKFEF